MNVKITLVIATMFILSALSGNTTTPLVYTVESESNTEQGLLQKYPDSTNSSNTNFGNNTIDGIAAAGYEDTPVNPIGTCEGCIVEFLSPSEIDTLAQRIAVIPGVVGICETLEIGIEQTQFRDVPHRIKRESRDGRRFDRMSFRCRDTLCRSLDH